MNKFATRPGIGSRTMKATMKAFFIVAPLLVAADVSIAGGDAANGEKLAATCAGCHGADGNSTIPANPKLAGQYESYLRRALTDYRSGARESAIMAGFATALSDQDIRDLAAWFSSQESSLQVLNK